MPTLNPSPCKLRRWARRKEERPKELLAAALELFFEHGFAATRLEDVATRAGVSKGTLYCYFPSKNELFEAVVRENMPPCLSDVEAVIERFKGDSVSLFRTIMFEWWDQLGNSRSSKIN